MAPEPDGSRRSTSKKPDLRKAPVEGSPLHRKGLCVAALSKSGDRATAAYNELAARDNDALQATFTQHKGDATKLTSALARLCARHRISFTHDHHKRTQGGAPTKASAPAARSQTAAGPRLALDPEHWSCTVRTAPTKDPSGATYLAGISLHDIEEGDKILEQTLGRGSRPDVALAIVVLGPPNPQYAGSAMAIPVLKRGTRAHKPAPVHLEGTLYQLGAIPNQVSCTQNRATVRINPEHSVTWVRIQLHEKDAIAATPSLHEAFAQQFSGAAPVNGGPRGPPPKKGTAQDRAREKSKLSRKDTQRIQLDDEMHDIFKAVFHNHFPKIKVLEPCKQFTRWGSGLGKRSMSAIFGIGQQDLHQVLQASGLTGATYEPSTQMAQAAIADKYQTIWFPDDYLGTLAEAHTKATLLKALGVVRHTTKGLLGIRALRDSSEARQTAIALRGSDASLADNRFRITGIQGHLATLTQVKKVLTSLQWTCEVYHVAFDKDTDTNFALVMAHDAPPNNTIEVNGSLPWTIELAPRPDKTPRKSPFQIVTPDQIKEGAPEANGAEGSGHNPANDTLFTKAGHRTYLHDLMTAQSPNGKDSDAREPHPKRSRSASLIAARRAERSPSATRGLQERAPRSALAVPNGPAAADTKLESGTAMETDATAAPEGAAVASLEPTAAAPVAAPPQSAPQSPVQSAPSHAPSSPWSLVPTATGTATAARTSGMPGSCPTPDIHDVHDSASESEDRDEFGSCRGITDASAQKLIQLETAHEQLTDQVDHIQDSVNQLLASQASLSEGLVKVDHGLAAACMQQQNDCHSTQQTLQLILQQLQQYPITNPAFIHAKTEHEEPPGPPGVAALGPAPSSNLAATALGPSPDGSPAATGPQGPAPDGSLVATGPPGLAPDGSQAAAAPMDGEASWGPAPDDSLDIKGSGKGKDDSGRPGPYY